MKLSNYIEFFDSNNINTSIQNKLIILIGIELSDDDFQYLKNNNNIIHTFDRNNEYKLIEDIFKLLKNRKVINKENPIINDNNTLNQDLSTFGIELINCGNFGCVLKIDYSKIFKDMEISSKYAIKIHKNESNSLTNEIKILEYIKSNKLETKNLLKYYCEFKIDDEIYIVTDYYELSLLNYLKEVDKENREKKYKSYLNIIIAIVEGLLELHNYKICHNDIHINNIVLKKNQQILMI
jgi:serine/threonine protein kinase